MYAYSNNKEECYIDRLDISEEKHKEYKYSDEFGKYKLRIRKWIELKKKMDQDFGIQFFTIPTHKTLNLNMKMDMKN